MRIGPDRSRSPIVSDAGRTRGSIGGGIAVPPGPSSSASGDSGIVVVVGDGAVDAAGAVDGGAVVGALVTSGATVAGGIDATASETSSVACSEAPPAKAANAVAIPPTPTTNPKTSNARPRAVERRRGRASSVTGTVCQASTVRRRRANAPPASTIIPAAAASTVVLTESLIGFPVLTAVGAGVPSPAAASMPTSIS